MTNTVSFALTPVRAPADTLIRSDHPMSRVGGGQHKPRKQDDLLTYGSEAREFGTYIHTPIGQSGLVCVSDSRRVLTNECGHATIVARSDVLVYECEAVIVKKKN